MWLVLLTVHMATWLTATEPQREGQKRCREATEEQDCVRGKEPPCFLQDQVVGQESGLGEASARTEGGNRERACC